MNICAYVCVILHKNLILFLHAITVSFIDHWENIWLTYLLDIDKFHYTILKSNITTSLFIILCETSSLTLVSKCSRVWVFFSKVWLYYWENVPSFVLEVTGCVLFLRRHLPKSQVGISLAPSSFQVKVSAHVSSSQMSHTCLLKCRPWCSGLLLFHYTIVKV